MSGMQGETEVSGIKVSRGHCPFFGPSPHRAVRLVLYLRFHEPGYQCLTCLEDPQRLCPAQAAFAYEWLILAHSSQQGSPTFWHLWATLEEEELSWATH